MIINHAGTIATGTTAQTVTFDSLARQFVLENPVTASEPLYFRLDGTAATIDNNSMSLNAGGSFSMPPSTRCSPAISLIATTTGHAFVLSEFTN